MLQSELSFLFPPPRSVQFDVVHQLLDLRHKQLTISCQQHVLNLHVLVSLCSWDSSDSWFFTFLIPIRHPHRILQSVRCHHQLAQRLDSEFSLDLQAHCSAMLVSRQLSIVHIAGFCGFHVPAQAEIENVVFEINWNKLVLSVPTHQFLEVISHSLTNFAVFRDHVSTIMSEVEILSSFARDL